VRRAKSAVGTLVAVQGVQVTSEVPGMVRTIHGDRPQAGGILSLQFSFFLPVLHGAVIPERRFEHLSHRWVLLQRFFPQLNTEARALQDDQI
jgi:hypothetical protein